MTAILTLTMNPAIDLSVSVPNVFPEHKLRCHSMRHHPGGGGINVSRAIKKMGGESTAYYCCGGPSGAVLRTLLDDEKISHFPIEVSGWTRQNMTVMELATGQQYRFVMPGSELSKMECQSVFETIQHLNLNSSFVVASGSLPPGAPDNFYRHLVKMVSAKGGRCILDTSGPSLSLALKENIFLIKPSLRELRMLAQSDLAHESEQEKATMQIIRKGFCEVIVVSLGPAGVLVASKDGCERLRSPTVPVRSKVGAGDSMVAGIVLGLSRNMKLHDAVRYGVAAGAAAVMNPGTELCHGEDVDRLFKQIS